MGAEERAAWAEQRRRAIDEHAAAQARVLAAQEQQARQLIEEFVVEARHVGLATTALVARAYNGRSRYRTRLRGWYLRADRTVAVGTDGAFYLLSVPASVRSRLLGAVIEPEAPRLIVGEGARDGESMPLQELLRQRLEAGDRWPPA